jgi:hypothetical protein
MPYTFELFAKIFLKNLFPEAFLRNISHFRASIRVVNFSEKKRLKGTYGFVDLLKPLLPARLRKNRTTL